MKVRETMSKEQEDNLNKLLEHKLNTEGEGILSVGRKHIKIIKEDIKEMNKQVPTNVTVSITTDKKLAIIYMQLNDKRFTTMFNKESMKILSDEFRKAYDLMESAKEE